MPGGFELAEGKLGPGVEVMSGCIDDYYPVKIRKATQSLNCQSFPIRNLAPASRVVYLKS